jgi:hypothetical protein
MQVRWANFAKKGETMNEFTGIKCPKCGKEDCRYCGVSHRTPHIPPGKTLREVLLSQQQAAQQKRVADGEHIHTKNSICVRCHPELASLAPPRR